MPDSVVRGRIELTGVRAARAELVGYRADLAAFANLRVRPTITVDDVAAKAGIASIRTEMRSYAAMTSRARLDLDTTAAHAKIDGLMNRLQQGVVAGAGAAIGFGIAKGLSEAGNAIIGYTGKLEQARVAYTNLLGSAQAADQFLGQLQRFSASTPFDLASTQKYAQLLLATGTNASQVIPTLTALGNAVSAIGGTDETLSRVVLALSQMKQSAHASAQDFNQLTQAGINGYKLLSDQIGVTEMQVRKMAESGEITGTQAASAIITQLAQRNIGLMQQQANTFLGRLENFQDNFSQRLSVAGKPLFDELSTGLTKAADAIASPKFQKFAGDMVHDLTQIVHAGEAVAGALSKIPLPVIEASIHLAEFAVAAKLVGGAIEFGTGLLGFNTAAMVTNTAATKANTLATIENDAARAGGAGTAARGAGAAGVAGRALGVAGPAIAIGEAIDTYPAVFKDLMERDFARAFADFLKNAPATPTGAISLASNIFGFSNPLNKVPFLGDSSNAAQGLSSAGRGPGLLGSFQNQIGQAAPEGIAQLSQLIEQVKTGAITADSARGSFDLLARTFGRFVPDIAAVRAAFETQLGPAIAAAAKQANDALSAAEEFQSKIKDVQKFRELGVDPETIPRGVFGKTGTGADVTAFQQREATQALSQAESAQKIYLASIEEMHKQAAADIASAWKAAEAEVGRIDLGRGISGLADASSGIEKVRAQLAQLGQTNVHLDALAGIASQFKAITTAEKQANEAFNGFMLSLTETDRRIQQIDTYRQRVLDAAKGAYDRQQKGTASQQDLAILANYRTVVDNLDKVKAPLLQNQATDIFGIASAFPALDQIDARMRAIIGPAGGRELLIRVQSEQDAAERDITALLTPNPRELKIEMKTNIDAVRQDVQSLEDQITTFFNGTPPGWIAQVLGLVGSGPPAPGVLDPTRGYGDGGGGGERVTAGNAGGGGAGWNQFRSLSQQQYSSIVQSGALPGTTSPLDSPTYYAAVIKAAQEAGVDPRVLLAFLHSENHNATDISVGLLHANNFAGIKYSPKNPQQGADYGPPVPANEQGAGRLNYYASFKDPADFFRALARNLSTGEYAQDYQSGNLAAVSKRYVGSDSPGRVEDYAAYAAQYPAAGGDGGSGGTITPPRPAGAAAGNRRVSLTMPTPVQAGASGGVSPAQVARMRKRAQELAGSAYVYGGGHGPADSGGYDCSGYVIEVLRAGGIPAPFTDAGGLYRWAKSAEGGRLLAAAGIQLGFFNPGAGGKNEHVAINIGGEWSEAGGQLGNVAGPSPNAASGLNAFVGTPRRIASGAAPGYGPGTYNSTGGTAGLTTDLTAGGPSSAVGRSIYDATAQVRVLQGILDHLDATGVQRVTQEMEKFGAAAKAAAEAQVDPTDSVAISQADTEAARQTADYTIAFAQALVDAKNPAADLTADYERLSALGGNLAASAIQWLGTQQQIAAVTANITATQAAIKDLDASHAATVKQRAQQDQQESRAATRAGWAQAAAGRAQQQQQQAQQQAQQAAQRDEERNWTEEQRHFEDRQRLLTQYGTKRKQQLDDELAALEKTHSAAVSAAKAREQGLSAAGAAGDRTSSMRLAIGRDSTRAAEDAFKTQKTAIADAITAEQKLASQQQFDLETERIMAQRAHEDRMAQLQDQATAQQEAAQAQSAAQAESSAAQSQADQEHKWQVEDTRQAEDDAYEAQKQQLQDQLDADQARLDTLKATQDSLDGSASALSSIAGSVGQVVSDLGSIGTNSGNDGGGGDANPFGATYVRQLGSFASGGRIPSTQGLSIVGENGPEVISAPGFNVTPNSKLGGDTFNITFVASGNQQSDDAALAKLRALMNERDRRNDNRGALRAVGGMR